MENIYTNHESIYTTMQTITISKLQKNMSLLSETTESIQVFNGTKGELVGTFVPKERKNGSDIMRYAGILHDRAYLTEGKTWNEIREEARKIHFSKKSW
jgi:thiamine monophosphate kinase